MSVGYNYDMSCAVDHSVHYGSDMPILIDTSVRARTLNGMTVSMGSILFYSTVVSVVPIATVIGVQPS